MEQGNQNLLSTYFADSMRAGVPDAVGPIVGPHHSVQLSQRRGRPRRYHGRQREPGDPMAINSHDATLKRGSSVKTNGQRWTNLQLKLYLKNCTNIE